jgi:hypothetical protein
MHRPVGGRQAPGAIMPGFVADLDRIVDQAALWLSSSIAEDGHGRAGWGWVPDVPPNPQNTAEVVCALTRVSCEVPRVGEVCALVRSEVVAHQSRGDWAFQALIDVAWRLRALRCLVADLAGDPDAVACARALVDAQDPETGGWRLAGRRGPVSVTATSAAVLALLGLGVDVDVVPVVRRGLGLLISSVVDGDERANRLYAAAQIVDVLSRPEIAELGGPRTERARELALGRVMDHVRREELSIEEEAFRRENTTDTWRHLTLHMSLRAVSRAAPERIFDPAFRRALIALLDLQERGEANVNRGGFRTSREGFVTSYATTQALEVLALLRATVNERVNPARTFDLLCRIDGAHHSDPQDVLTVAGRTVTMNSWAGAVLLAVGLLSGATTAALSVALGEHLGTAGSRALVVWGTAFVAVGMFGYLAVRLPATPNGRIAAAVFGAFTALILPVLTYLLS